MQRLVLAGAGALIALGAAGVLLIARGHPAGPLLIAFFAVPALSTSFGALGGLTYRVMTLRMATSGFLLDEGPGPLIRVDPELAGQFDLNALRRECAEELDDLAGLFGRPLRRRVRILVFANAQPIRRLIRIGNPAAAAFPPVATIVLARSLYRRDFLRHELVHLFASRWNGLAPKLLSEGLAVYLQADDGGRAVDAAALRLAGSEPPRIAQYLDPRHLMTGDRLGDRYLIAGSFVGFLIRRLGWDDFRRLYTRSTPSWGVRRSIERALKMDLEEVERRWLAELETLQVLRRRLESQWR